MTSRILAATPDAPADARHFVHDSLDELGCEADVTSLAELLVSEVVTDALREHPDHLTVRIEPSPDGRVRCEVATPAPEEIDEDRSDPVQRRIALCCVDEFAHEWASDLDRTRTSTWFELARTLAG